MEALVQLSNELRALRQDVELMVGEIIEDNRTLIEDINIGQLQEGQRADGEILPDYSPVSVFKYGKPPGPIKLYDTGDFYRGITVEVFEKKFEMIGKDSKTEKLEKDFGAEILGIGEDGKDYIIEEILLPELVNRINLKFAK